MQESPLIWRVLDRYQKPRKYGRTAQPNDTYIEKAQHCSDEVGHVRHSLLLLGPFGPGFQNFQVTYESLEQYVISGTGNSFIQCSYSTKIRLDGAENQIYTRSNLRPDIFVPLISR